MKIQQRILPLTIGLLLVPLSSTCQNSSSPTAPVPVVPFCDLFKNSQEYLGKTVTTTVRITAFKHGTALWDPACRAKGADMHSPKSNNENPSVIELDRVLRQYGMGDHPVVATLTGKWLGSLYYKNQFLAQPRFVFEVTESKNITRFQKIDHR